MRKSHRKSDGQVLFYRVIHNFLLVAKEVVNTILRTKAENMVGNSFFTLTNLIFLFIIMTN